MILVKNKPYYVYILKCSDGSLYTGITNNLERRVKIHNEGKGAKYTASRLPVKLVYKKRIGSKSDALKIEFQLKKLTRQQKLEIIEKDI